MNAPDRQAALQLVSATLAADLACDEEYFARHEVFIVETKDMPGRRRFPFRARSFAMATMGAGVVVSCSADRLAWAQVHLGSLDRDALFSAATLAQIDTLVNADHQTIAGPVLRFVCSQDTFRPAPPPDGIALEFFAHDRIHQVYEHAGFHEALGYRLDSPRPDMGAVVARHDERVIGIAGASADSDHLWQIGVQVLEPYRGRGVGKALVNRLTAAVLAAGNVPYYSTVVSNLHSSNIALGLGYRLMWVDVYSRET